MKKSRTFRKSFVAAIAALCLAAPLAMVPVSAHDITITQPSDGGDATHTYVAYQIFSGNYDSESKVLSNINWGSGIDQGRLNLLVAEIQRIDGFSGLSTASDIAKKLGEKNSDKAVATSFAKIVGKYLSGTTSGTSSSNGVTGLNDGYYLIKDGTAVSGAGAKTDYILEVAGRSTSIEAKSSIPTIVKKVQENTELEGQYDYTSGSGQKYDNYNDVADYNIGDDVPFLDDGTLPSDFDSYDDYYYQIVDTPGDKFTPNITDENGNVDKNKITVTIVNKENGQVVEKEVWVDGSNVKIEYVNSQTDTTDTIKVTFGNIRKIYEVDESGGKGNPITVDKDSHVTVEYTAKLDSDAEIGLPGQESKVKLNFSNDPNEDYNPTNDSDGPDGVGTTPEDKVIVFTYELDITKYLGEKSNDQKETEGKAGFKLYKTVDGKEMVAKLNDDKRITGWEEATNEDVGTQISTDSSGVVKFIGIDEGTYTIKETDTPNGYNTMEPKTIVIAANTLDEATDMVTTVDRQEWTTTADKALLALKCDDVAGNLTNGKVTIDVENFQGSTLPSTGGIGTTIFYLGGGTMAAVAGVYLITKKRMKNEEDDEI